MMRCCSSLCSSGCFGRKRVDSNLSDDVDDDGQSRPNLEDLLLTPNKIDSTLEKKISEWQEAINEYKLYEDNFLDLDDPRDDLRTIIKALRKSPKVFLSSTYSVNVRKLAEKKIIVDKLQKKLGLSKEMRAALLESDGASPREEDSIVVNPMNASIVLRDSSVNVSTKISVLWAARLNDINPTQGALQVQQQLDPQNSVVNGSTSGNESRPPLAKHASLDLKVRPKWPDFLVDISFDVIKVNRFGHQMRRTLKLTQNHVISIKNGCVISKFYHFNEVRRTWLENGNTIRVQQRNDKHNIYMSPIAPHILQQIITRVQVRSSLDKTEFRGMIDRSSTMHGGGVHSSAAIASIIKNIAEENTLETEAVMATFAIDLKMRAVRTVSLDLRNQEEPSENSTAEIEESSTITKEVMDVVVSLVEQTVQNATNEALLNVSTLQEGPLSVSEIALTLSESATNAALANVSQLNIEQPVGDSFKSDVTDAPGSVNYGRKSIDLSNRGRTASGLSASSASNTTYNNSNMNTPRFLNFKEGMPEFSAQKAVQGIIFDDASSEGNTRKLFIEKFSSSVNSSVVDGKAKLLEVRLFIDGMHEYILTHRGISLALLYEQEKQRSIINDGSDSLGSNVVVKESDKLVKHRQLTRRNSLQFLKENMDLSVIEESILVFISFIIFIVVEEALFLPLKQKIISFLPNNGKMDEENLLTAKMKALCNRSQQQWGVPDDLVSPMGWQSAIFELAGVEHNLTPSSQLHILTRTVKAIYNEFKLVVLPRLEAIGKHDVYIGADDLVPIFLYVFCHSNLRHPIRNRDLMWSLCHPDQLHGEGGYYLTVYESAIEFVSSEALANETFNIGGRVSTVGSRSSMTSNPLFSGDSSVTSSTQSSRGFDGIEDGDVLKRPSKPQRRMTAREKFLDTLAFRLRGFHHFVTATGGVLSSLGSGGDSHEESRARVMSGEYAMRESFY